MGNKIYSKSFISTSRASAITLKVTIDMFTLPFSRRCMNWLSLLFISAANAACVSFLFCLSSLIRFPKEVRRSLFLIASSLSSFFIFGNRKDELMQGLFAQLISWIFITMELHFDV